MQTDIKAAAWVGDMNAAADFMGPGAIETNLYQAEILDLVRRRFYFGQRISMTPATGQPSRYFEQLTIPSAAFTNPRVISATASQPQRVERTVTLKGITAQINYSLFDTEVTQQQSQFAYLEAKDLADTVDGVLKLHDLALWTGNDTHLMVPTTLQYFGVSGQIVSAAQVGSVSQIQTCGPTDSLVDCHKTQVSRMVSRQDYEVRPTAIYLNPLFGDLFDQEAKALQLYYNETEIVPGVIVKALPTQAGLLPLIPDAGLTVLPGNGGTTQYSSFIITEELIEYHYLTNPLPRVFQLGLLQNLAAQFTVVKFGAVVAKAPAYAHSVVIAER
jgi:hypothetical protein